MQELDHTIDPSSSEPEEWRLPSWRRVLTAAAVIVTLLVLALVPPLISVNRLQRRIAHSISDSLGRPVHLDGVTLNILPWPGFTLQNFVVSEDPAFGYEPTIRANTVTARLRIRSLWRHQVEFTRITFTDPSLNLVRNAQGQWNIENVLLQASRVNAAPTAQQGAGLAPRFPYIEATGARINIKSGNEKLPISLTDADFALWLPIPNQWHVRLEGLPLRTDANVTETGTVRVEGTLDRAASFNDLPIALSVEWLKAPLGAASALLTGRDAGWRGNLDLTSTLTGTIGTAVINARTHLSELRRADFVPANTLDLDLQCSARSLFRSGVLTSVECTLPTSSSAISITGDLPDIHHLSSAQWQVSSTAVPVAWCIDWARLFSQRIPATLTPEGNLSGTLSSVGTGNLHSAITLGSNSLDASMQWNQGTLTLQPSPLHLGKDLQGVLTGAFTRTGYTMHLAATGTHLLDLNNILPPAADSLDKLTLTPKIDVTCTRIWGSAQTCSTTPEPTHKKRRQKA